MANRVIFTKRQRDNAAKVGIGAWLRDAVRSAVKGAELVLGQNAEQGRNNPNFSYVRSKLGEYPCSVTVSDCSAGGVLAKWAKFDDEGNITIPEDIKLVADGTGGLMEE